MVYSIKITWQYYFIKIPQASQHVAVLQSNPTGSLFVCFCSKTHHLSFSKVLFLLLKRSRSRVFLFRKMITVATRRLTRVTRIATVMTTLSADAIYDNTHINTHTRTSTAQNNDRTYAKTVTARTRSATQFEIHISLLISALHTEV